MNRRDFITNIAAAAALTTLPTAPQENLRSCVVAWVMEDGQMVGYYRTRKGKLKRLTNPIWTMARDMKRAGVDSSRPWWRGKDAQWAKREQEP